VDVRQAFAKTMEWGFVDVFRKHHPEPGQYTFFDYRVRDSVRRGLGWRIDHVMASCSLAAKSSGAWIDLVPRRAEKPSDHAVLVAEFTI
jgi:exodeoxyribonuclease-3